jgi:hypothetical protein
MRLLVHGSGFKYPFPNEMAEIKCAMPADIGGDPTCNWTPSNPDLEALAKTSGGSTPIADLDGLARFIEAQKPGSIDELRILGHSSEDYFALSGKVLTNDKDTLVTFDEPSMIGESKTFLSLQTRFQHMRDRFAGNGRITLAGCGSGGTNAKLLDVASRTFLVCVDGFQRPIQYAINKQFPQAKGQTRPPRIGPGWRITYRGRVSYSPATLKIEEVLGDSYVVTDAFSKDAWSLKADATSCVGQQIVDAAKRINLAQIVAAAGAADLVGWRIMSLFFRDKVQLFSGVRADATLRGVGYEAKGPTGELIVGIPYAQMTNPLTIDQRIAEMGELIKYAEMHRSGTVLMK